MNDTFLLYEPSSKLPPNKKILIDPIYCKIDCKMMNTLVVRSAA